MIMLSGDGMEECEICGKRSEDIYVVNVEEAELRVCTRCAKGKKIVSRVVERKSLPKGMGMAKRPDIEQLVDNYGAVIHEARERMKIPVKVLAEMLNEKETIFSMSSSKGQGLRRSLGRSSSTRWAYGLWSRCMPRMRACTEGPVATA